MAGIAIGVAVLGILIGLVVGILIFKRTGVEGHVAFTFRKDTGHGDKVKIVNNEYPMS